MSAAILLVGLTTAAVAVPELSVADRCAVVGAVLDSKAKMPVSGMRTVDVRFPDIAGVRNRANELGRPLVKADWLLRHTYRPMFDPAPRATCRDATFVLLWDGPEDVHGALELALLVTLTPVANHRSRFAFEETLGRNPSFSVTRDMGGVAVPAVRYSGIVEKGRPVSGRPS